MKRSAALLALIPLLMGLAYGADLVLRREYGPASKRKEKALLADTLVSQDVRKRVELRKLRERVREAAAAKRRIELALKADELLKEAGGDASERIELLERVIEKTDPVPGALRLYVRLLTVRAESGRDPGGWGRRLRSFVERVGVGKGRIPLEAIEKAAGALKGVSDEPAAFLARVAEDPTAYQSKAARRRAALRSAFRFPRDAVRVTRTGKHTLRAEVENPLEKPVSERWRWRIDEATGWSASPEKLEKRLAPGARARRAFTLRFRLERGLPRPAPVLERVARVNGEAVLRERFRLELELKAMFGADGRVARAPRFDDAPQIDGALTETLWDRPAPVTGFVGPRMRTRPPGATKLWLAHGEGRLYVAARCEGQSPASLQTRAKGRDGDVWQDDGIELFFQTSEKPKRYDQIGVNAAGTTAEIRFSGKGDTFTERGRSSWNPRLTVAVGRIENGWTLELAVPLADLRWGDASAGDRAGFNAVRNWNGLEQRYYHWSPTFEASNHVPERFGTLVLE